MSPDILLWMPGGTEIFVILLIVLLLFGGKKIPELMKGIGKGIREFKNASKEDGTKEEDTNKKEQIN